LVVRALYPRLHHANVELRTTYGQVGGQIDADDTIATYSDRLVSFASG
jgi:hypothetical protein